MRTFAMGQYAATYWVLVAVFVYTIALIILPELDSPDAAGFPPVVGVGVTIALAAAAVSLLRSAPRRPWLWIVALVPAVLFLLINAIYLPYPLTHPADPSFTDTLTVENTSFAETSLETQSGKVLGLFIVNRDGFAHSFDIDALDIHVQLPANATTAAIVKSTAAGTLEYYCAVPGHREAGMVGTMTAST